jgi:hypothetical protein
MLFGLAMNLSTTETRAQNHLPSVGCWFDDVVLKGRRNAPEKNLVQAGWPVAGLVPARFCEYRNPLSGSPAQKPENPAWREFSFEPMNQANDSQ